MREITRFRDYADYARMASTNNVNSYKGTFRNLSMNIPLYLFVNAANDIGAN